MLKKVGNIAQIYCLIFILFKIRLSVSSDLLFLSGLRAERLSQAVEETVEDAVSFRTFCSSRIAEYIVLHEWQLHSECCARCAKPLN